MLQIVEKQVNNKIKINPTENGGDRLSGSVSECVENLGGTILEMNEIDEIDYIIESVYDELIADGYDEIHIGDAIDYALSEAKITYGHDTSPKAMEKKRESLLGAAKQRLSGIKSKVKKTIASGARGVARGALGVARRMDTDKSKPSPAHSRSGALPPKRPPSGAGQKERVSSGSYQAPSRPKTQKKSTPIEDLWKGSFTTPQKKPKETPKPEEKTTKVSSELIAKRRAAALRATRRNPNISKDDLDKIVNSINENTYSDYVSKIKEVITERKMTSAKKEKEERLGKRTKSALTAMIKQYGPEKGPQVYYAWKRKQAMKEDFIDEAKLPRSERKKQNTGKSGYDSNGNPVPKTSRKKIFTDLDDTVLHPHPTKGARIHVKDPAGKRTKSLTSGELPHHNLPQKHTYDFGEFGDTDIAKKSTTKIKPTATKISGSKRRSNPTQAVTARAKMNKPGEFEELVRDRGGMKGLQRVHYTGGMKRGSGPEKKEDVTKNLTKIDIKRGKKPPSTIVSADDSEENARKMSRGARKALSGVPGSHTTRHRAYKVSEIEQKPDKKPKGKPGKKFKLTRIGSETSDSPNTGIRSGADKPKTLKQRQRIRRKAMGEEYNERVSEELTNRMLEKIVEQSSQMPQEQEKQTSSQQSQQESKRVKQMQLRILRQKMNAISSGASDIDV